MTVASFYLWMKALHVAAMIVFIGGVLFVAYFLRLAIHQLQDVQIMSLEVQRWSRKVTTPAMLLAWVLGIQLVMSGGWSSSGWLWAKVVLVIALSGIHGMQAGSVRKLSHGKNERVSKTNTWLTLACVFGISVLAVVKPF